MIWEVRLPEKKKRLNKRLSATFVKTVNRPGRYGDGRGGGGLSLLVRITANGRVSKTWSQRIRVGDRQTNIGLGNWPIVALAEAREQVLENRRLIARGKDPRAGGTPTFEEAVEEVIEIHREGWRGGRNEAQWRSSLATYVFPKIGETPVDRIDSGDVLAVLRPIWLEKHETARRIKQRISAVMKWAVVEGHRITANPVDGIEKVLPKPNGHKKRFRSLPHAQVGGALRKIRSSGAWPATKDLVEFLALTAVRPSEARLATWCEIDLADRRWTIPPERTKALRRHRVPLSEQAAYVLDEAAGYSVREQGGLVFPAPSGKAISIATPSKILKDLGIAAVPHGFRSSFRSWADDEGYSREVSEAALGHVVRGVEGAYQRSDLLVARRELMEAWGSYLGRDGTCRDEGHESS